MYVGARREEKRTGKGQKSLTMQNVIFQLMFSLLSERILLPRDDVATLDFQIGVEV